MGAVLSPFSGSRIGIVDQYIRDAASATCAASATWVVVLRSDNTTPFELDIPAAVGDRVDIGMNAMRSGTDLVDIAVIVGSSQVRYMATGTSTPAADGNVGWYASSSGFFLYNMATKFVVTAGDLDNGKVRFSLVSKGNGSSIIESSTTDQFYWCAKNYGPA